MLLQSFWDINRQTIRKTIDFVAGAAVSAGVIDANLSMVLVAVVVAVLNAVWWWIDNRKKATVKGLEESSAPGTNAVAAGLAKVLAEPKKKGT